MAARKKIIESDNRSVLAIDLLMITVVIFNLSWLFFDMAYAFSPFRNFLDAVVPRFNEYYGTKVHPRFIVYDLIFVSIYITEFTIRWIIAVVRKTYSKWFFYPFLHWYDVLGCLPISGFRVLRLLRVFSMVYRLERLGVINLSDTYIYKEILRYRDILVEEISDRVVINVLDGVQDEIQKDSPVMHRVVNEVLMPRQEMIVDWTSQSMAAAADKIYSKHKETLKEYLETLVKRGLYENKDFNRLRNIPGIRNVVSDIIESSVSSVSDVTFNIINETMEDIIQQRNKALIESVSSDVFAYIQEQSNATTEEFFKSIIHDILEIVKAEVAVKQWQVEEEKKKAEKIKEKVEQKLEQKGQKRIYFD